MSAWDYRVLTFGANGMAPLAPTVMEANLQAAGKDGWEAVAVFDVNPTWVLMKRAVPTKVPTKVPTDVPPPAKPARKR